MDKDLVKTSYVYIKLDSTNLDSTLPLMTYCERGSSEGGVTRAQKQVHRGNHPERTELDHCVYVIYTNILPLWCSASKAPHTRGFSLQPFRISKHTYIDFVCLSISHTSSALVTSSWPAHQQMQLAGGTLGRRLQGLVFQHICKILATSHPT